MARKSATKPAEDKAATTATEMVEEAKAASAGADDTNAEGGEQVGNSAAAADDALVADVPGPVGGEDGTGTPAATEADKDALLKSVAALGIDPALIMPAGSDVEIRPTAAWTVVCHRDGGRRRAGRHWPSGETLVQADELTDYALAQLHGDPQFTILSNEQD